MNNNGRNLWWLLALESALSFSYPCWVVAAGNARPATYPARFVIVLLGVACLTTLLFHIGPALFVRRFGPPHGRFSWLLTFCLCAGYVYSTILLMERTVSQQNTRIRIGALIVFLLLCLLALVRSWWKPAAALGLVHAAAVLSLTLITPWHGLWTQNNRWVHEPEQFDSTLAVGLLVVAAPALAIGWRVGCVETRLSRIWLSGILGLFLPLCLAVSIVSLMAQAGENLYWRPSFPLGFEWALSAVYRSRVSPNLTILMWAVTLTALYPTLLGIVSLRILTTGLSLRRKLALLVSASLFAWYAATLPGVLPFPPYDRSQRLWALAFAFTGAAMGIACLLRRKKELPIHGD